MRARKKVVVPIRRDVELYRGGIPPCYRQCARKLTSYTGALTGLSVSRNRQTKAYTVCLVEVAKWVGLGTHLNLSDIPKEPRFELLKLCLSQLIMDGLVDNYSDDTTSRRLKVMGGLADKLNSLHRLNSTTNKLHLVVSKN